MQARMEEWCGRWNRDNEAHHIVMRQMQLLRQQAPSTTPRNWTGEVVRHTLSSMKGNRARRIDGCTPSEMLRLPKKAIEGLSGVLPAVEESLALPTQICANVVALLGKPNGAGERPITLTGPQIPWGRCGERKQRIPEWLVEANL